MIPLWKDIFLLIVCFFQIVESCVISHKMLRAV